MIPILYDISERNFTTNGIGRLSSCTRCVCSEERNGVYELEFDYPITGVHYSSIQEGVSTVLATHDDTGDMQPFDVYGRSAPLNGIVTFYAHHISYRLSDIVVMPFTATGCAAALQCIVDNSVNANPFSFWTDKPASAEYENKVPTNARAMLGGQQNSILDVFGAGDYEWDRFLVKLHAHRGTDSGVQIRYGKNLSDIKHDTDMSETYNAIVPYYLGSNGELVTLPEKMLVYEGATLRTAYLTDHNLVIIRTEDDEPIEVTYRLIDAIPMDLSGEFDEVPTEEELREVAITKFESSESWFLKENITVDFVQLWQTEEYKDYAPLQRVKLCDTVEVFYKALGIDAVRKKVVKTTYNVLLDRYDSIELGDLQTSIAQAIAGPVEAKLQEMPTISMMDAAIDTATELIRGGLGGYVVMNANANGQPQEILIMDEPDINEAVQVIRMNRNGIAFSRTGYNGPFLSAWTIDGAFVADFITAGTLNANVIRAGIIADILGNTSWNLETGVLNMTKGSITLGGGNFSVNDSGFLQAVSGLIAGWTIQNSQLYAQATSGTDTYTMTIAPNNIRSISNTTVGGSKHNLIVDLEQGGIRSTYDSTLLSIFGPSYDSSYNPVTAINCYKALAFLPGAGGSLGYRYGGIEGAGSYGAMHLFQGSVKCANSFTVSGTKSRQVDTENYQDRLLYCYETPTPLFGDIGEAQLDEEGICYVDIDDIFTETIADRVEYQVFLQKEGQGDCWIAEKGRRYFVIQGTPELKVAWELKAKQRDYEMIRLEHQDSGLDEYEDIYDMDSLLNDFIREQEDLLYG